MGLTARVIKSEEALRSLFSLRYEIFTAEQAKYRSIADHQHRLLRDDLDEVATHIVVEDGGQLVGGLRQVRGLRFATPSMRSRLSLNRFDKYSDEEFGFSGRLCIIPRYRGTRALFRLLERNFVTAQTDGVALDFIFCNPHIIRQYESLGYRRFTAGYEDKALGYQTPMVLFGDDRRHLSLVNSPFYLFSKRDSGGTRCRPDYSELTSICAPSAAVLGKEGFIRYVRERFPVQDFPLFQSISISSIDVLVGNATLMSIPEGQSVGMQGTPAREVFLVLKGAIAEQTEPSLNRIGPGQHCGQEAFFRGDVYDADFTALEHSEILVFDAQALSRLEGHCSQDLRSLMDRLKGF